MPPRRQKRRKSDSWAQKSMKSKKDTKEKDKGKAPPQASVHGPLNVPSPPPVDENVVAPPPVDQNVAALVDNVAVSPESSVATSTQLVADTLGSIDTATAASSLAGPVSSDGAKTGSGRRKRKEVPGVTVTPSPANGAVVGAVAASDDVVTSVSGSALGVEWGGLNPHSESTSPLLGPSTSIIPVSPMKPVDNGKGKERPQVGGKSTSGWRKPPVAEPSSAATHESTSPLLGTSTSIIPVSPMKTVDNGKGKERPQVGGKSTSGWKNQLVLKPSSAANSESSSDQDSAAEEETGSSMKKTGSSKKARSEKETVPSVEMPSSSKETVSSSSVTQKPTSSTKTSYEVKRHKGKKLKDPLQGISKNEIKRLARRAGVSRIGGGVYEELRLQTQGFLDELLFKAFVHTEHRQAKTVTPMDVVNGFKTMGGSYLGA